MTNVRSIALTLMMTGSSAHAITSKMMYGITSVSGIAAAIEIKSALASDLNSDSKATRILLLMASVGLSYFISNLFTPYGRYNRAH